MCTCAALVAGAFSVAVGVDAFIFTLFVTSTGEKWNTVSVERECNAYMIRALSSVCVFVIVVAVGCHRCYDMRNDGRPEKR